MQVLLTLAGGLSCVGVDVSIPPVVFRFSGLVVGEGVGIPPMPLGTSLQCTLCAVMMEVCRWTQCTLTSSSDWICPDVNRRVSLWTTTHIAATIVQLSNALAFVGMSVMARMSLHIFVASGQSGPKRANRRLANCLKVLTKAEKDLGTVAFLLCRFLMSVVVVAVARATASSCSIAAWTSSSVNSTTK